LRKSIIALLAAVGCLALAGVAHADRIVRVNDPTGEFTSSDGNKGFVELNTDGAKACNYNEKLPNPAGDGPFVGFIWVGPGNAATVVDPSEGGNSGPGNLIGDGYNTYTTKDDQTARTCEAQNEAPNNSNGINLP
jgi:hypothetical protein